MSQKRTIGQYRGIDLTFFAIILIIFESLIGYASKKMFPGEVYTVSVTPVVTAIVMMRWGPWAAIHAVLGGLTFCRAAGGGPWQYLIYGAGNLFALAALAPRKAMGAENIRKSTGKTILFGLCVIFAMYLGRAAVSLLTGVDPAAAVLFVTTDVITLLFTLVVLWIARRLDGLFEDQRHYLYRLEEARRKEEGGWQ